jgi:thiol-disulfide isomerase/thioredoxin
MLENIKKSLGKMMSFKYFLLILLITSIFIIASLYTYKKFVVPRINPNYVANKEFIVGTEEPDVAEIYFFYTTWCPHCKNALPIWKNLKDEIGDTPINGFIF